MLTFPLFPQGVCQSGREAVSHQSSITVLNKVLAIIDQPDVEANEANFQKVQKKGETSEPDAVGF